MSLEIAVISKAQQTIVSVLGRLAAPQQELSCNVCPLPMPVATLFGKDGKETAKVRGLTAAIQQIAFVDRAQWCGADAAQQCVANQWIAYSNIASKDLSATEARVAMCKGPLLLGSTLSVADVAMYLSIVDVLHATGPSAATMFPSTIRWALAVEAQECMAPHLTKLVKSLTAAHKDPATGTEKGKASAAKSAFVKPTAEEIAARQAAKQKEKEEKAKQRKEAGEDPAAAKAKPKGGNAEVLPSALDIRVGRISGIKKHPEADKLYVEQMDVGEAEKRTIVSGLVPFYASSELDGKLCLVICNMKPKPLVGVPSHGMVLCAAADGKLALVSPPDAAKPGDRVQFGALDVPPQPVPVPSSKQMTELLKHLRTDEAGKLTWKDHAMAVPSCGQLTSSVVNAEVR